MKTNKIFILLMMLSGWCSFAQQDPQYTQYMYNTINVNPAYAGSREVLSVFGMYRTQWVGLEGAPDTGVFAIHSPLSERVGLGATFTNDRIGIANESTISVDFSYHLPLSENYKLALGIKGSAHLLNLEYSKLNLYNPNDPTMQEDISNRFSPNVGAGAYLYSDRFYLGLSVPNILQTDHYDDNVQSTAAERMHGYLITGYVFDLGESLKFKPAAMLKAVKGAPLQLDVSGNFLFFEKLTLGAAWRWSAAISGLAGFQVNENWFIGYAYDAETTKLANYNSGSHEIFLRYEFTKKSERIISPRFF